MYSNMEVAKILRNITKEEALSSYEALKALPCNKEQGLERAGLKALDLFFFHHRIKTKTKNHLSFYDAIKDPEKVKHLNKLVEKYKKTQVKRLTETELIKKQYDVFQLYYGTINQFRPASAKWLYCQMKPKVGILDFSAGWGGRCLAAISMGIPYIGIDANKNLEKAYDSLVKTYEPDANVKLYFQPSETFDFSKHKYDLIFTSPPYFKLEEYEEMPEYPTKEAFLDKFFIPVVEGAWKHLAMGGHMALNMPAEMYDAIKGHLPHIQRRYVLPLVNRHAVDAARQEKIGKHSEPRGEYIYVWHKRKAQTRKYSTHKARIYTQKGRAK
jgi:16S rRNA G966 N2-methylase RsmD